MKTLILLFGLLLPVVGSAQQYSIDWHNVSGGGGVSSGASYILSGTIGQPDSGGELIGGRFSLTGGFWVFAALQNPGTPRLIINSAGNGVIVSWPASAGGFVLEISAALTSSGWAKYGGLISTNAGLCSVTVNPPPGMRFFRLRGQ